MLVNRYIRAAAAADRLPDLAGLSPLDALALPIKATADDLYADLQVAAHRTADPAERAHVEHALDALPLAITEHVRLGDALAAAAAFDTTVIPAERVDEVRRLFADAENQLERLRYTLIHLTAI